MSEDEIISNLEKFKDYLDIGSLFSDPFRWLGWVMIKGLAFILDGLEKVTNEVLLVKKFFQNPEVVAFVTAIRPFLYILLAFSILYAGYMLIFQKKFDREGMAINLFIALTVIALLGTGMEKANEFTDEAINAIGSQQLYEEEEGTLSDNILSRNINDLLQFDRAGWSSTEVDQPNNIPLSMISGISITEKLDSSRSELNMSKEGTDLSKQQLIWVGDKKALSKLDQSGVEWNNQYYYRFSPDWLTLATTIIVMAFTLFSIAYKLARLSFDLAFNYILAIIISPADVHDGQKTKKILQSIMNTFLVIILIFLSMKVYMIGTSYLADTLDGFAYLIALIAFSVAVVDGPNIVERLFGIDAGLKSGWGLIAGAYAGSKMLGGVANGLKNSMNKGEDGKANNNPSKNSNGTNSEKAPSPNDEEGKTGDSNKSGISPKGFNVGKDNKSSSDGSIEDSEGTEGNTGTDTNTGTRSNFGSVAKQAEEQTQQRNQTKAPSPNDVEQVVAGITGTSQTSNSSNGQTPETTSGLGGAGNSQSSRNSNATETANVSDNATVQQNTDITGVEDTVKGGTTGNIRGAGSNQSPTDGTTSSLGSAGNSQSSRSSNATETARVTDNATIRSDSDVSQEVQGVQGNATTHTTRSGGTQSPTQAPSNIGGTGSNQTTSGSHTVERNNVTNRSIAEQEVAVTNEVQEIQGNATTHTTRSGGTQSPTQAPSNIGGTGSNQTTSGSHTTEKHNVTSQSTLTQDTNHTNEVQEIQGNTMSHTTGSSGSERKRPRNYKVDKGNSNMIDRMKGYKRK